MRSRLCVLWSLALVLLLVGCGVETLTLRQDEGGGIEPVGLGALIRIRLDGNASTGYVWTRVEPEGALGSPLETLQEGAYLTDTEIPGSPGVYAFDYHAMQRGTITLAFEYKRPWEDEPVDTFTTTIWIQ